MAKKKALRDDIDELRSELAALRKERAEQQAAAAKTAKQDDSPAAARQEPEEAEEPAPEEWDLEQSLRELSELGEKEIAEHPVLAVTLAFLLGFAAGRISKA